MKKILLLFFLMIFCLSGLSIAQKVNPEKAKLQRIKKELKEKKAKLLETKKKEQKSLSQLVQIKSKLKKAGRQLKRAKSKIVVNEETIKGLKVEIRETDLLLSQKADKLRLRIREIFKNSSVNYLDLIFGARNMSDFINRSYFFSKLVETDVNLINLVSEQNKSIKTKRQNLEGVTTEIKQLADIINTKQNEISVKRKEEQRVYAALKGRRLNYEKRIAKLERSSVELTQIIQNKVGKHVTAKGSGLLEWPLRGRITSRYGYRRHPYWGGRQMHRGLDIAAPYGRPIKAADGGVVIMAKWWDGYGKAVVISHGRKTSTVYGHMSRIYVQTDDKVAKGQIIGLVGSTGYSTGPHLHFEVRKNGKPTNPIKYLP